MCVEGIIIDSRLEFSVCFDYFVTGKLLWGDHVAFGGIMGLLWGIWWHYGAMLGQSWGI